MRKVFLYLSDVKLELSKVVWPKKEDVIKLTLIVFVISAIVAVYVGGIDFLFTKTLEAVVFSRK